MNNNPGALTPSFSVLQGSPASGLGRPAARVLLYGALAVLLLAFCVVIVHSYQTVFSGRADSFSVSEWLINYGGGFVRRGLGGALILQASQVAGVSPRTLLFAIMFVCYGVIFASTALMLWREPKVSYFDLLLAVSPFVTLFPLIHRVAGQRKEVLLLALAGVAGTTRVGRLDSFRKYLAWALALAALVGVHDGLVFFLPVFVVYLKVLTPPEHPVGYRALLLLAPAAVVFLCGYLYSAHVDIAAICDTMSRYEKGDWCTGPESTHYFAAAWLKASATDGMHAVVTQFSANGVLALTLSGGALALLPIGIALRANSVALTRAIQDLPWRMSFVWLSLLALVPLFAVASDWNRWFYILASLLTFIYFGSERDREHR